MDRLEKWLTSDSKNQLTSVNYHDFQVGLFQNSVTIIHASLVAQKVKNLPAMQETQVQSLGQKDSLTKGMATHSNILAWRELHGHRSLAGYNPRDRKESDIPE